jgi:hypothetical protein
MRAFFLLLIGGLVTSCAAGPPQPVASPKQQLAAQRILQGKVAGRPMDCISSFTANDMTWLDRSTVAFKRGSKLVYVNHFNGGCDNYGGRYAMVTRQVTSQMCRGDIVQLIDPVAHYPAGSCVFGDFIPYRTPGK